MELPNSHLGTAGHCLGTQNLLRYKSNCFVQARQDRQSGLCPVVVRVENELPIWFLGRVRRFHWWQQKGKSQKVNRNERLFWEFSCARHDGDI